MKLLVTGGAGYIGSHTAHLLVDSGHDVVVLDNFVSGQRWAVPSKAKLVEGDFGNRSLLKSIFAENKIDAVLHFAASIEVGESVQNPAKYFQNNVVNALSLFDECVHAGVKSVIFSSTATLYGEPRSEEPLKETLPLNPLNPYGASKQMAERILQDLAASASGRLKFAILRYFNAAGARRDLKVGQATPRATHLIKVACEVATGLRESLTIYGTDYPTPDGTCRRDYVHIEDLAQAHLDALNYLAAGGASDIFNVGYGRASSVLEVVQAFERANNCKLKVQTGSRRPGDPSLLLADTRKIRENLKWQPRFDDLELICRTAFEWEKVLLEKRRSGLNQ
jgi:UDP-glucose 4-epimerase